MSKVVVSVGVQRQGGEIVKSTCVVCELVPAIPADATREEIWLRGLSAGVWITKKKASAQAMETLCVTHRRLLRALGKLGVDPAELAEVAQRREPEEK